VDFMPTEYWEDTLRLIDVASFRAGHRIDLAMSDEHNRAVAFLVTEWT
jgi:hypothetical protein